MQIRCPACFHKLVRGKVAQLESIVEHVSDPNGDPAWKQSYICPNPKCDCNEHETMWLADGEGPYNYAWHWHSKPWYVLGNGSALFSWWWRYDIRVYFERKGRTLKRWYGRLTRGRSKLVS